MIYKNKKIENNIQFIEDAISKKLPINHICSELDMGFDTFKKYFPSYCGSKISLSEIEEHHTYGTNPKKCTHCDNFLVFAKRKNKFCSSICAAIANNKIRSIYYTPNKIKPCTICSNLVEVKGNCSNRSVFCSDTCRSKRIINLRKSNKIKKICNNCNEHITGGGKRYCSNICWREFSFKRKNEKAQYKLKCAFNFNVYEYPNFFDLSLIDKFGWYSPSNKKNNLNGISRDHCISINDGYIKNINPDIIAHPANCRLINHVDNQIKKHNSIYTLDMLLEKILAFEKQYTLKRNMLVQIQS
jgi:hypothetical protein